MDDGVGEGFGGIACGADAGGKAAHQPVRQHPALIEAVAHVAVDLVHAAAADGIVGMVLEEVFPGQREILQVGLPAAHARHEGGRFGPVFKQGLALVVGFLEGIPRGERMHDEILAAAAAGAARFP